MIRREGADSYDQIATPQKISRTPIKKGKESEQGTSKSSVIKGSTEATDSRGNSIHDDIIQNQSFDKQKENIVDDSKSQ